MIVLKIILIVAGIFGFMYIMGKAFENDLEEMEETHPDYRKHLKNKYKL